MAPMILDRIFHRENPTAETRRTQRRKAGTEPREAFGVRRIPALSFRRSETSLDHTKAQRRDAAHSKRFATLSGAQNPRNSRTCCAIAVQSGKSGQVSLRSSRLCGL